MGNWDKYFLEIAKTVSIKSKDPSTKVGAVVVDNNNRIISTGFNGFPVGVKETPERWERPEKYSWVCHAELNALVYAGREARGATLYCTHKPCENCAKYIIQFGVTTIVIPKQQEIKDPGSSIGKMETHARTEVMFSEVNIQLFEI